MEFVIEKSELQILINLLGEIRVSYPLFDLNLLTVSPDERGYLVKVLAKKKDFWFSKRSHELPEYSDFYECFISSGIITYENVNNFMERLESYQRLGRGISFAPDTNVLYHRFISNFRPLDGYEIVIAEPVKSEIENAMNYKYKPTILEELERIVRRPSLLREFYNRRTKKSRKAAYIALNEFEALRDRIIIAEKSGEGHNNDEVIVKTLKRFDEMSPALLVFLTADVAATDVAELEGLEYFLFDYPREDLGTHHVPSANLRTLLFNLAAVFGVIKLNDVLLFGEFGGKRGLGELKLVFNDVLAKEMKFHLDLSRRLISMQKIFRLEGRDVEHGSTREAHWSS